MASQKIHKNVFNDMSVRKVLLMQLPVYQWKSLGDFCTIETEMMKTFVKIVKNSSFPTWCARGSIFKCENEQNLVKQRSNVTLK